MAKVCEIEVQGRNFDVNFNADTGVFSAKFEGEPVTAEKLANLKTKLAEKIKASRAIQIPASLVQTIWGTKGERLVITDIVLTGWSSHFRRANYEKADDPKRTGTVERHAGACRRLTDEEKTRVTATYNALEQAKKDWDTLRKSLAMDIEQAVKDAAYLAG
jgi:hypothetical protein